MYKCHAYQSDIAVTFVIRHVTQGHIQAVLQYYINK